jgi:UDP-GlcNAc3NAcA epimerase
MKIITVLGARPQFIKAATVSRAFKAYPKIEEILIHTGQHFDAKMSDVFFSELEIPPPKYNLGINSLSHGAMTGRMLEAIEKILMEE